MAYIGEMQYLTIGNNTYSLPTGGGGDGTVTSIGVANATNGGLSVSGSPITTVGTITIGLASAYGDTKNPYGNKTANYVLAGPSSGSAAAPSFRALVAADIPDLSGTYSTTDEKLKTTRISSDGTYYPLVGDATYTAETKYYSGNFRYSKATGIDSLQLGQVSNSSTSKGRLTLCSGPYYTYLDPPLYSTISANQTYTLPASSGTIALTSDLSNYLEKTFTDSGYTGSINWYPSDLFGSDAKLTATMTDGTDTSVFNITSSGVDFNYSGASSSGFISVGDIGVNIYGDSINIVGVVTPIYDNSAANKKYVDDSIAAIPAASITLNGTSTTSASFYAPTSAGTSGQYLKSNGSGAPSWSSISDSDENVKSTLVTTGGTYYIVGSSNSSTNTSTLNKHDSVSFFVTTNTSAGDARLILGNSTASGTNSKKGLVRLYGSNAYYTDIISGVPSENRTITLPNATGTIALISDIPSVYSSTNTGGYLTMSTLPIYNGTVV